MPKKASIPRCSEEDRKKLDAWTRSRTLEARLIERAKIIINILDALCSDSTGLLDVI